MKTPSRLYPRVRAGLVALLFALASLASRGEVREVGPVALTVADLDREIAFFTRVLSFRVVGEVLTNTWRFGPLSGQPHPRIRQATLQLGDEVLELTQFPDAPGDPIPIDSRSHDQWFQHVAIVVSDLDRAYQHLRAHRVRHVSTAPQTLPAWNPAAGGIRAFYFQDPEAHVLEGIWFPPGKGAPKWHGPSVTPATNTVAPAVDPGSPAAASPLFLGIDHTAIVVADTERSLAFYRDRLGLALAGVAENWGTEQEHLNQVFGARLRITALRAPRGPGIEFLEYLAPPGGRPLPPDAAPNDLVAWRIHLRGASNAADASTLATRVGASDEEVLERDPDGHLLQFTP